MAKETCNIWGIDMGNGPYWYKGNWNATWISEKLKRYVLEYCPYRLLRHIHEMLDSFDYTSSFIIVLSSFFNFMLFPIVWFGWPELALVIYLYSFATGM